MKNNNTDYTYPLKYDEREIESVAIQIAEIASSIRPRPPMVNIGKFAACKFCGQLVSVSDEITNKWESQNDAIEYATTHCECQKARAYTDEKIRRERAVRIRESDLIQAKNAIYAQFGPKSDTEQPVSEEICEKLLDIATMIYDGKAHGLIFTLNSRTKAVICKNSKGKLLIDRKENDSRRIEIG